MIEVKKFSAVWCGPCRMLAQIMPQVQSQVDGVRFNNIDVDEYQDIAQKYGVRSVPTVVIEKDGQEVQRIVGAQPAQTYIDVINKLR